MADSATGNNISIDMGSHTVALVAVLIAVVAACGVVMGIDIAERSAQARNYELLERQYRMVELKLDDWTVVAHRSGLILPGDYTRGPQGNLDAESYKPPKGK